MPTVASIDQHVYGTNGVNGGVTASPDGGTGGGAPESVDNDALDGLATGGLVLEPGVTGGSGGNGEDGAGGHGGNAGGGAISWSDDTLGAVTSPYVGDFDLLGSAMGGIGGAGGSGGALPLVNGNGGGIGGLASDTYDTMTIYDSGATEILASAQGGLGGKGGMGADLGDIFGDGGAGADGGGALAALTNSLVSATSSITLDLDAVAGAGGNGGSGGAGMGGGDSGGAAAEAISDNLTSAALELEFQVTGAPVGKGGLSEAAVGATPGQPGQPGPETVEIQNSTFTLAGDNFQSGDNTLTLTILVDTTNGVAAPLDGTSGGNLVFSGNHFVGEGNSTLDLGVQGGGVNIDALDNQISIGGSAENTMTGFTNFVLDKSDTIELAPGDTVTVNSDPDTIVVTAGQVGGTVFEVTSTDAVFDFVGFSGLTVADLNADSTIKNGNTVLNLDGGTLTLEGYSGGFSVANTEGAACFLGGTQVALASGEAAVETLAVGDLVMTFDGVAKPVRWIGRQTVSTRFADPNRVLPIRIMANALGENVPCRDLLVSPDHAFLVDGVLIQAGALVNGTTIRRERRVAEVFTYYHVELDDHALIFAENVPAETFIDNIDRMRFDNWAEHEALYPAGYLIPEMRYPRAKSARQVPRATRSRLAARGTALVGG